MLYVYKHKHTLCFVGLGEVFIGRGFKVSEKKDRKLFPLYIYFLVCDIEKISQTK